MLKFIIFCALFSSAAFCRPSPPSQPDEPEHICGISAAIERYGSHNTDKIIEGNVSRPGDWPWVTSLKKVTSQGIFGCTSTLISDKWILTAAHCVFGDNVVLKAFAGSNKVFDGQELIVEKFVYHPLYKHDDPNSHIHDIALVEVSNVTFSDTIKPICLSSKLSDLPRDDTIAVGWGKIWDGHEIERTYVLREDLVPIEPWKHCNDVNETMGEDPETEICAGKGMHSVYHGDSGGPLMEIINGRFYEIGVTSRGLPTADSEVTDDSDFEDIFTYVPAYCDWIFETTNGTVKCE